MSRKESVTRGGARAQSISGPPVMEVVTVAVLPPRLPPGVAPPTGLGAADAMAWDERVNWMHNEQIEEQREPTSSKKFLRKAGITTQRKKANAEIPPFVFRKVPYDTWRDHYAKDKEGRYKGLLAPAEDCLLMPEDVERWREGEPETKADLWTRGKSVLPVYEQAQEDDHHLPEYTERYEAPPPEELRLASVSSRTSAAATRTDSTSGYTADGKTSEQIIREAKERAEADKKDKKKGWKNSIKRGAEFAMLGAN